MANFVMINKEKKMRHHTHFFIISTDRVRLFLEFYAFFSASNFFIVCVCLLLGLSEIYDFLKYEFLRVALKLL